MAELLHTLTRMGYRVSFHPNTNGMLTVEFRKKYDLEFYDFYRLGTPGGAMERLNTDIHNALYDFHRKITTVSGAV